MSIPNDPVILLSYINTQLRDFYPSLEVLSDNLGIDADILKERLAAIDDHYDSLQNKFV